LYHTETWFSPKALPHNIALLDRLCAFDHDPQVGCHAQQPQSLAQRDGPDELWAPDQLLQADQPQAGQ
jgi:hypothetical protein